jgi:hypothetical protein
MDKRELERIKKQYPLFEFEILDKLNDSGTETMRVSYSKGSSQCFWITKYGALPNDCYVNLNHEHMEKALAKQLEGKYPDLHFWIHGHKDGISVHVSVNRGDREGTGIGVIDLTNEKSHATMNYWQAEAVKSKKEGCFFCSGHQKAEPKEDYCYFYFMGSYCKKIR